jgi:hypothetical protein
MDDKRDFQGPIFTTGTVIFTVKVNEAEGGEMNKAREIPEAIDTGRNPSRADQ